MLVSFAVVSIIFEIKIPLIVLTISAIETSSSCVYTIVLFIELIFRPNLKIYPLSGWKVSSNFDPVEFSRPSS